VLRETPAPEKHRVVVEISLEARNDVRGGEQIAVNVERTTGPHSHARGLV
jgi:hypothetical protein